MASAQIHQKAMVFDDMASAGMCIM